jgi:methyl-accepting chemotaxis protein
VTGQLTATAENDLVFIFGRGAIQTDGPESPPDDGRTILQAIKNWSVLVVLRAGVLTHDRLRAYHERTVVAMLVEAIHALQHDRDCIFRDTLLGEALEKVEECESFQQGLGESKDKFRLRTVQKELAHEKAMRIEGHKNLVDENYWFKQKNMNLEENNRKMKMEYHHLALYQGDEESDAQFHCRTSQAKLTASEIRELEAYQENRQLKVELALEKGRHERTEYKREGLKRVLERRDLEILQLKENSEVLQELSELDLEDAKVEAEIVEETLQGKVYNAEFTVEDLEVTIDQQEDKIDQQANKIESLADIIQNLTELLGEDVVEQAKQIESQAGRIESQAREIESQAGKIETQRKEIRAGAIKSARLGLKLMRKTVQWRHKLAK